MNSVKRARLNKHSGNVQWIDWITPVFFFLFLLLLLVDNNNAFWLRQWKNKVKKNTEMKNCIIKSDGGNW